MEGPTMSSGYRQVDSFESAAPTAAGVGAQRVAFGIDTSVVTVAGSQRTRIDHGHRIDDIAVAERVLVLSAGTLTAYTVAGDQVWSQSVGDANRIAAVADSGSCGVLSDTHLRAVDIDTGHEQFAVERTRPGSSDDAFLATDQGFVYGTWSFLTGVDADGELLFDRDLSAVVESIGYCGGTVIVALQSGRLTGIAASSGESNWQLELEPVHVTPTGEESVFVSSNTGIHTVSADGISEPVSELPRGDVYATTDGSVVCTVRDGLISTHVHDRNRIEIDVTTTTVGVGGTIDLELSNLSDEPRTADLSVSLEGCSLSPSNRTVSLEASETTLVDFPVASVDAEGDALVTVAVDGAATHEAPVTVEDAASGTLAVETSLEPTVITDGTCELTVTVTNTGGVALDKVGLLESGTDTDTVPAGASWTGTVTRQYDPERRISVGLEVVRGDRRREYAPTCTLPSAPTVEASVDGDVLRATVSVDGETTVSDRLVIEMPGAGRVRSPVTIDGDELLLVVPQYEDGVARIALDAIDVDERVDLSGTDPFSFSSSRESAGTLSNQESAADRSPTDSTTGSPAPESSGSRSGQPQPDSTNFSKRESEPAAEPTSESQGGLNDADASPSETSHSPATSEPQLAVSRELPESVPGVGHVVRDQLTISNDGAAVADPVAVVDGDRIDLGRLPSGATTSLARFVAAGPGDSLVVPAVEIEAAGTVVAQSPEQQLPVAADGIDIQVAVDGSDGTAGVVLTNNSSRDCRVTELSVGSTQSRSVDATLAAGDSAQLSTTIDTSILSGRTVVPLSVSVRYDDGSTDELDALGAILSGSTESAGANEPLLSVSVGSETQVAGEYGSVVLVFENEHSRALGDVSVAAEGEPIDDMFYSEARREQLAPGDWIEHFIDMESGIDSPQFDATVSYRLDDETREYTLRVAGPAVDDEASWTDSHLEAWSVERLDSQTGSEPEFPSTLSTSFRQTE